MAIEASFTVDQPEFPLNAVFEQLPDATVELDRVVPTSDAVIPYFWIYAERITELTLDLTGDEGVDDVTVIDELDEQLFVRIDWNLDHESVLTAIVETDVTLLSGIGTAENWTFELRSSDQQEVSEFQSYCRKNGIPIRLTQLHALAPLDSDRQYDLTDGQRTALILAYSRGYFDSPRAATQADLAEELEISHQAVSSRLQRGIRRLVASTVVTPQE
ncbi:Bacterio-opsin activator HTH domain protein [Haloterrigena turkmenica DSM 5511]|uniref:Bacterio-opsin activator HTH domain protein n=1 Tax=Haloterrigena turkmenica (strain ATCC 51198 / DSM 5511 / JCM 9101 / NCIMB 13204 / VKM B-1734 / 4k) TaxID=543526 RepID=D2RTT0_HALTV|nr:helix-turn-helix domain-containing protein [Haloterrigena turkmenica]ADB61031.1 Bacterio-opsin activator HTH domain protein [Haloterrigena turkmenica DSM 5511]